MVDDNNKENICSASESSYDLGSHPQPGTQSRKSKKGDRSNLRKSLTWNQAFFTEEGVLDHSELSLLCVSATKSSASHWKKSSPTKPSDDLSPLRSFEFSAEGNSHETLGVESNFKLKKASHFLSDSIKPLLEDALINEVQEKTKAFQGTTRNILVAPSTYSLKRTIDAGTIAPSKLPKFSTLTSHASSVSSYVNCSTPTRPANKNLKPGKRVDESAKFRSSMLAPTNNNISLTTSIENSEEAAKRKRVIDDSDLRKHTISSLPKPQIPPSSRSFLTSYGSSRFEKVETTLRKNPGSTQLKASGLKMPTPSVGFFCSDKSRSLAQKESQALFSNNQPSSASIFLTPMKDLRGKGNQSIIPDIYHKASGMKTTLNGEKVERKPVQICPSVGDESSITSKLPQEECSVSGGSATRIVKVDRCEINAPNVCGAISDGKPDVHSNSAAQNHLKLVGRYSSFRTKRDANSHLPLPSSSYEKRFQPSQSETSKRPAPIKDQDENASILKVPSARPVKVNENLMKQREAEKNNQNNESQPASRCPCIPSSSEDPVKEPKDTSILLNQLKAAPFSDEWIAALETFGEDILQVKSGAVQNSPKEKSNAEPGPWSPVKRKNLDVGPYDCTKYTKNLSATDKSP
ncbi:uncharacterized protein LOC144705711 isoform X2 [Wolffia australiana]